jgi:Domain of unknown function (DUF4832)/Domain of unknown function (DUF4874)
VYQESQEDPLNPERGFYIPSGTKTSHFRGLDANALKAFRSTPRQLGKSSYAVTTSLLYRDYELDSFRDQALSPAFLDSLQKDFDAVREAGLKMILRFAYTNSSHSGDCKDGEHICPPYGDASPAIVLQHIAQLQLLLQKNADIIAVLQEGFIGIWGENYYSDYFGDASGNGPGTITDSSWRLRNRVLSALLQALPASRMIQVRTPQIKQKYVYGPHAGTQSLPLDAKEALISSDKARIGFHNDCFLSSPDDYGTYADLGSSVQIRQPALAALRKYIEADTKYTVTGGETCDDAFSPQNDCAPAGYAEQEMRRMHYSFLNAAYNNKVNNDWDSAGCLYNIRRQLGYRFVLRSAVLPVQVKKATGFIFNCRLENLGYASLYNPRTAFIVLRNTSNKKEFVLPLKNNPRLWYSGTHQITERLLLPANLPAGSYQVFLSLPDQAAAIAQRPEYAIQFCNAGGWEPATGYNDLHHQLLVK